MNQARVRMLWTETPMKVWILALGVVVFCYVPLAESGNCPLLAEVVTTDGFREAHRTELRRLRRLLDAWVKKPENRSNGYLQQLKYTTSLELLMTMNFIAALQYHSFNPDVLTNMIREIWWTALYRRHFLSWPPTSETEERRIEQGVNISVPQTLNQGVPEHFNMAFDFVVVSTAGNQLRIYQVGEIKAGQHNGAMRQVHDMLFSVQEKGIQLRQQFFPSKNIWVRDHKNRWVPIVSVEKVQEADQGTVGERMDTGTQVVLLRALGKEEQPDPESIQKILQEGLILYRYNHDKPTTIKIVIDDSGKFDDAIRALRTFFAQSDLVRAWLDRLIGTYTPAFHPQSLRISSQRRGK